jgi:glycosyltransferase A (GT-A) superfamily protein (DUF2064 family)
MESLIVLARGGAVVDKDGLAQAMVRDTLRFVDTWRHTQGGVDPNRRVIVLVDDAAVLDGAFDDGHDTAGDIDVVVVAADVTDQAAVKGAADADFARGARAVAAITGRSPTLPSYLLDHAFRALQFEPVVVGPTADGAAWLVGLQRGSTAHLPPLGVPQALSDENAREYGVDVNALALLPFWYVIPDVAAEALPWMWHLEGGRRGDSKAEATLSVLRRR